MTPRTSDELRRPSLLPAATAAAALASLHNHRPDYDWDSDQVSHASSRPPCRPVALRIRHRTPCQTPTPRPTDPALALRPPP